MNSGLFGPRGASHLYYTTGSVPSYGNSYAGGNAYASGYPYASGNSYTSRNPYPGGNPYVSGNSYTYLYNLPTATPYSVDYLTPSYGASLVSSPCFGFLPTSQPLFSSNPRNTWGIVLPERGLESILIAILVLVALDMVFVRPLKNKQPS